MGTSAFWAIEYPVVKGQQRAVLAARSLRVDGHVDRVARQQVRRLLDGHQGVSGVLPVNAQIKGDSLIQAVVQHTGGIDAPHSAAHVYNGCFHSSFASTVLSLAMPTPRAPQPTWQQTLRGSGSKPTVQFGNACCKVSRQRCPASRSPA